MRRLLLAVPLLLAGCASTWQTTYAASKTAAEYIDRTHARAWSDPLDTRVDHCAKTLPADRTDSEVDACLGPFIHNPDVLEALERYNASADILAAVLLATDPEAKDQQAILDAWADVLAAARDLLALFPEAETYLRQLDALTRRAR